MLLIQPKRNSPSYPEYVFALYAPVGTQTLKVMQIHNPEVYVIRRM